MKKIIAYPLTVLYFLCFGFILILGHIMLWVLCQFSKEKGLKVCARFVAFNINLPLRLLGTRIRFELSTPLPMGVPLIFVSNHQSTYDISVLVQYFRKHYPRFISKKELGKGIPFISAYLRNSGCVLIDRKDGRNAILQIKKFAQNLEKRNWSAIIFPEGTRSRDGKLKPFRVGGLSTLMENMPSAYVVPVSINNSWKLASFPMGVGAFLRCKAYKPIKVGSMQPDTIVKRTEELIRSGVDT